LAWRRGWLSGSDDVSPWFRDRRWRPMLFGLGVVTGLVALLSPIDRAGDSYLFSMHMVQHLLLMMVAPPLVLLGIAGLPPAREDRGAGGVRATANRSRADLCVVAGRVLRLLRARPAAVGRHANRGSAVRRGGHARRRQHHLLHRDHHHLRAPARGSSARRGP